MRKSFMFSIALIAGLFPAILHKIVKKLKDRKKKDTKMKVLFVLRARDKDFSGSEGSYSYSGGFSSGLNNSVAFILKMMDEIGVESKMIELSDNNQIDKAIHEYKPTHVIIEALWVVPSKMIELEKLHKKVRFFVRLHSEIPFIATEGMAMGWIHEYLDNGIVVTANSPKMASTLEKMTEFEKIPYLPNYYPIYSIKGNKPVKSGKNTLDVGCFGAIRLLKNQLQQACAAIIYCIEHGKKLKFHINASRIEGKAEPVLKNLRELFKAYEDNGFELVEHGWKNHSDFLTLTSKMDILLQVSYSETFNIVAADAVSQAVPVVGSSEIPWLPKQYQADPNDVNSITHIMHKVLMGGDRVLENNLYNLSRYNMQTVSAWCKFLNIKRGL